MNQLRQKKEFYIPLLVVFLSIIVSFSNAQVTWDGDGGDSLWTTAANWSTNIVPDEKDDVQVDGGVAGVYVILKDTTGYAKSLIIDSGDTLVIESADSLDIDKGDLTINGVLITEGNARIGISQDWIRSSGIFEANQSTITFHGNSSAEIQSIETFYNLTLNKDSKPVTNIDGLITILNDLLILDGTLAVQDFTGTDLDVAGDITVGPDNTDGLDLTDDAVDSITVTLGGDFAVNNGTAGSFQAGTSTIIFDGSGTQQITTTVSGDGDIFENISVQKSTGQVLNINSNIQVNGDFKIESGDVSLNSNQLIFGTDVADSLLVEATFEVDANAILKMGSGANLVVESGGELIVLGTSSIDPATITQNSGTYNFEVNSGGTIQTRYYKIEYMDTSGIEIKNGAIIHTTNNFSDGTIDNTALNGKGLNIGDISGSDQLIQINNVNFPTNPGGTSSYNVSKYNNSTDTFEFVDATGSFAGATYENDPFNLIVWTNVIQTLVWIGQPNEVNWHLPANWSPAQVPGSSDNVEIPSVTLPRRPPIVGTSNALCNSLLIRDDGILTINDGWNLDISGDLSIGEAGGGSVEALNLEGSATLNLTGDYFKTDASNFNDNTSTVIFDGTGDQQINTGGTSTVNDAFYNVQINKTSGTVYLMESILITGNFTLTNGEFNAGSSTTIVYCNWANSDTFMAASGNVTFAAQSPGPFTINPGGTSFNNITINAASQTYTHAISTTDLDINGNLTIAQGTLDANSFDITLGGDWTNNGSFTHSNATVTFDGLIKQILNGGGTGAGKPLYNLTSTNSDSVELSGTLAIDGDLDLSNGVFNTNGNTVQFGDASDDSIIVSAELLVDDGSEIQLTDGGQIVVNSGGLLTVHGSSAPTRPLITNQGSGNYTIDILNGGTIAADMATFEYTTGNGITINSSATINSSTPFDDVLFQNGSGTAYLTISNGQTMTATAVQFDSAAAGRTSYNLNYSGSGQIRFSDYTGTMSGVSFENDNGSGLYGNIRWNFQQTEIINNGSQTFGNDLVISSTANLGTVSTQMFDQVLGIARFSVARYYTVLPQNGATADVRLYYGQNELNGQVESSLQLWSRSNGIWEQLGGTPDVVNNYIEVSGYTFSAGVNDTLILSDATTEESLPVELISFSTDVFSDSVVLKWETASELENASWLIEKKILSRSEYEKIQSGTLSAEQSENVYHVLAEITGMGSKATNTYYRHTDNNVISGQIYVYKLSSISFGGEIESFPLVFADIEKQDQIPLTYQLENNYPNPFNPDTYICFQLPFESEVRIEVYNIIGQKIVTLIDGQISTGSHQVRWDGLNQDGLEVASGVYVYRIMAKAVNTDVKFFRNKKMILVR